MVALKMSKERIRQIDSYLKRKSRDKNLFIVDAKKALKTSEHTISKRLNALNIMSTGQDTKVLENTITELNKWLKENSFTVQGKKYFDNEEFIKKVQELENIQAEKAAIKRASYISKNVLDLKGAEPLKIGRGKKVKALGEALDNNPEFKKAYKARHGSLKIATLTNDQLNTLNDTLAKLVRYKEILPADAITEAEFLKRIGLSKSNVDSLRTNAEIKATMRGKKFNELFKPTVLKNQGTFYSATGLNAKIKQYKDFMDLEFLQDKTIERANKFKNSEVIQKFLDNKDTDLWTKKGRAKALSVLGKGTTPYEASYAMSTLARAYNGEKLREINVRPNKAKGEFIWKHLTSLKERDPWSAPVYHEGLRQVDRELKGVGSFRTFKDTYTLKMNEIFDEMGTPKKYRTSINEIVGVKGPYRNQMAPYSAFVDLTRSDLNRYIAGQQSDLSKAMAYLEEYKKDRLKFSNKIKQFNEGLYTKGRGFVKGTNPKRLASIAAKFGQEAADQVKLASLVEGTDVESVYSKADLDRWKKKGLDLRKSAKQKGYFIDVKGARPFFEVTVEDLKKAVAGLGKKDKLRYCSLLARGGLPGDCAAAIENDPIKTARILSEAPETSGVMGKVRNVAKGFLGALGRFGPAAGKYGAIAAAGAVAQPLVKQFRNDDPSTYLTDPDQQAGMLTALIEGERPKPRSEILDWGMGAGQLGATAAAIPGSGAMYKARRGLLERKIPKAGPISEAGLTAGDYIKRTGKGYGKLRAGAGVGMKLLSGMFTPAGLLATEPLRIAQKRREGESWGEIGTDPMLWMGPAFAPSMTRMATRGMNPASLLPKLLRLGMSRAALAAMGPVGWAGLAASLGWTGYEQYQDYKKGRGFFASEE